MPMVKIVNSAAIKFKIMKMRFMSMVRKRFKDV